MSDEDSSSANPTLATTNTNKRARTSPQNSVKQKGKKKSKTLTSFFAANANANASTSEPIKRDSPTMKAFPGPDLNISPGAGNGRRLPLKNQIRRIEIKNLNLPAPSKRIEYIKNTQEKLRNALDAILHGRQTDFALEHLYKCVMNLCQDRVADQVWQDCLDAMTRYIDTQVAPLESRCTGDIDDYEVVLNEIFTSWSNWTLKLKFIRNVYFYLDRDYLYNKVSREPMWETGVKLFSKRVLHRPVIEQALQKCVYELLAVLRSGDNGGNTHPRLRATWEMMSSNAGDRRWFIDKFFEGSYLYCSHVVCDESMSLSQHMETITRQLIIEEEICTKVFDFDSEHNMHRDLNSRRFDHDSSIMSRAKLAIQVSLLKSHDRYLIIFKKVPEVFAAPDGIDLAKKLYEYSQNVNLSDELRQEWHECVKHKCEHVLAVANNTETQSGHIVLELIKLFDVSRKFNESAFSNNSEFVRSWREAFEVLSEKTQYIADALEKHIDRVLRSSKEQMYTSSLEAEMEFVVEILRFVPGKDYFRVAHERDLARRQLRRGFGDLEDELTFISYLKKEFGSSYTENMEAMMKDVQTSMDDMTVLKKLMTPQDFDFSATLVSKKWPSFGTEEPYMIPKDMAAVIGEFERLYIEKYPRRLVTWQHSQGTMSIRARLACGVKEITTSQVQGLILLMFNDRDSLNYEQIRSALVPSGTSADSSSGLVKRSLLSLTHGKVKVLTKSPDTKEVHRTDTFALNNSLKFKSHKIRIPMLQMPRAAQDAAARVREIEEQVRSDRSYEMQAAATRIMKARRQLRHGELVQLVVEQMRDRGQVVVADVKKCIEALIQDEFFARNPEDPDVYDYIA